MMINGDRMVENMVCLMMINGDRMVENMVCK